MMETLEKEKTVSNSSDTVKVRVPYSFSFKSINECIEFMNLLKNSFENKEPLEWRGKKLTNIEDFTITVFVWNWEKPKRI